MSVDVTCSFCAAGSVVLLAWMDAALIAPRDRILLRMGLVSAVPIGLLAGGNLLLWSFDLAWRNLPGGADGRRRHSVPCGRANWDSSEGTDLSHGGAFCWCPGCRSNHRTGRSGVFLYYVLILATGAACFTYAGQERMIVYKGQTLLEVDNSFLDPMYDYYTYRGPVFRGAELLSSSQEHRLDENP